jgi:Rod binding domain-containing protein
MLDGQIAKGVGNSSTLGIGDMLYAKLEPLVKKPAIQGTSDGESVSGTAVKPARLDTNETNALSTALGTATLLKP